MAPLSKQAEDKAFNRALNAPAAQILELLLKEFGAKTQEFAIKLNALAQQRGQIITTLKQIESEAKSNKKLSSQASELLKKQSLNETLKLKEVESRQQTLIQDYNLEQAKLLGDTLRTQIQLSEVIQQEVEKNTFS